MDQREEEMDQFRQVQEEESKNVDPAQNQNIVTPPTQSRTGLQNPSSRQAFDLDILCQKLLELPNEADLGTILTQAAEDIKS